MPTQTIEKMSIAGIGIDVSKEKLDIALRLDNQDYLDSSFRNDAQGIDRLCVFLKKQEAACAAPLVIESTGDYHLQSALMIKQREYNVKVINPITTKRYQKSSIRNAKTDKIDARRLSDIAVLEDNLPDFKGRIEDVQARKLASLLSRLEKARQQLILSLRRFKETAEIIGLNHSTQHFQKSLEQLEKQIDKTKSALVKLLPENMKGLSDQTKGLSQEKLAVIHSLLLGKEFQNTDQLTAFFGLDIAVRKSGKWSGKSKLSKRGNAYGRKILYQIAWGLKTHNQIFRECYLKYRQSGKYHYNTIMVILARKFLRYYFSYNFKKSANNI